MLCTQFQTASTVSVINLLHAKTVLRIFLFLHCVYRLEAYDLMVECQQNHRACERKFRQLHPGLAQNEYPSAYFFRHNYKKMKEKKTVMNTVSISKIESHSEKVRFCILVSIHHITQIVKS